jgi:hypothetical protein
VNNSSALMPVTGRASDRFIPYNATISHYGDEYAELERHLYVRCGVSPNSEILDEPAEQNVGPEGNSGAEPGWLVDDELTQDWLRFVEEYRAECDAADRQRLLNDPAAGEATS